MDIMPKTSFWLIGQKNIQNSLLLGHLQQNLDIKCEILDPSLHQSFKHIQSDHLICIDTQGMKLDRCGQIMELLPSKSRTILINLDNNDEHEYLLNWPQVCGFLYKGASQNHTSKGIISVLKGELWFSRKLLSIFVQNNRRKPVKVPSAVHTLTKREKQILRLSASGAKNAEIAEHLNVSTHTVKTHLYNLFKKINVSNRIQAINWANSHLPQQELAD